MFDVTLEMITTNFEDYPEHRIYLFTLLKAVNSHCFPSLFAIKEEHQRKVVDSIVWALKVSYSASLPSLPRHTTHH